MRSRTILIVLVVAIVLVVSAIGIYWAYGENAKPEKTNRAVVLLCNSGDADSLLREVREATGHIIVSDNITALSTVNYDEFILMIEGSWIDTVQQSELVNAIKPLTSNGTPVIVINGISEVLDQAQGSDYSGPWMKGDPPAIYPCWGIRYNVTDNSSSSMGLITQDHDLARVTYQSYQWGSRYVDPV
jgi:hypothetical protein